MTKLDHEDLLIGLLASKSASRFQSLSRNEFKDLLISAETIKKSFNVTELKTILSLTENKINSKWTKANLVNFVSETYGDSSKIAMVRTPPSLKNLATASVKNWNVEAVNIAYAQLHFMEYLHEWESENIFRDSCTIKTDTGTQYNNTKWYAQPCHFADSILQPIIDPHHPMFL